MQPGVMIPHVPPASAASAAASPYLDYTAAAYAQYSDQYPYAASPAAAGYITSAAAAAAGYGYVQQPLASPGSAAAAFAQYQPQQLQTDRMQ